MSRERLPILEINIRSDESEVGGVKLNCKFPF